MCEGMGQYFSPNTLLTRGPRTGSGRRHKHTPKRNSRKSWKHVLRHSAWRWICKWRGAGWVHVSEKMHRGAHHCSGRGHVRGSKHGGVNVCPLWFCPLNEKLTCSIIDVCATCPDNWIAVCHLYWKNVTCHSYSLAKWSGRVVRTSIIEQVNFSLRGRNHGGHVSPSAVVLGPSMHLFTHAHLSTPPLLAYPSLSAVPKHMFSQLSTVPLGHVFVPPSTASSGSSVMRSNEAQH